MGKKRRVSRTSSGRLLRNEQTTCSGSAEGGGEENLLELPIFANSKKKETAGCWGEDKAHILLRDEEARSGKEVEIKKG